MKLFPFIKFAANDKSLDYSFECDIKFESSDEGEKKMLRVDILANAGEPMQLGYKYPVVLDFKGARFLNDPTPILMDHDPAKRVGFTDSQSVNMTNILASGPLLQSSDAGREYIDSASEGFPWQASVGGRFNKRKMELLPPGKKAELNGRTYAGPLLIARESVIKEISVTTLGADSSTSAKLAATFFNGEYDMEFSEFVASLGFELDALTDDQKTKLEAMYKTQSKPPAKNEKASLVDAALSPPDLEEIKASVKKATREAHTEESSRLREIEAIEKRFSHLDKVEYDGAEIQASDFFANAKSDETMTCKDVELACFRAAPGTPADSSGFHAVHIRNPLSKKDSSVIECSLVRQHLNYDEDRLLKDYGEQTLEATDARDVRNYGLHQVMLDSIMASDNLRNATGSMRNYLSLKESPQFVRTFLESEKFLAASPTTAMTATNILENVGNKALIKAYEDQMSTWREFCAVKTLKDFKTHSFYQLQVGGGYVKVPEDGEIQHGEYTDQKFTLSGDTYGMILSLTYQTMVNDDLDAFLGLERNLGRVAAQALEFAVYELLLGNANSFFSSGNGNYSSGTTTALSISSLETAENLFVNQVDSFGRAIGIAPDRILVSPTNRRLAEDIYGSPVVQWTDSTASGSKTKAPNRNSMAGRYRSIYSPYLSNTALRNMEGKAMSNQSSVGWYMFAPPEQLAAINVGFLNGQETPVLEQGEPDFDKLGIQYRAYNSWGVAQADPKGAVFMKGEA